MKSAFSRTLGSWSYSRYKDYQTCPAKAKFKHIDKLKEPPSPAMERGAAIAKASEDYLLGKRKDLVSELQSFKDEYVWLKKQKSLFVEEMWGFTAGWAPVAWNDWNACVLRVKIDAGWQTPDGGVHIRDGKTGKFREDKNHEYEEQLELYAAAAVSQFPATKYITTALWYTDQNIQYPQEPAMITAQQAERLQKKWDGRVKKMLAETKFEPTPGRECQWCAFSKAKGGPCKY